MSQHQKPQDQASKENKYTLTIIVQGKPYKDEFNANMPMEAIANKALEKTKNTGRPLSDWQLTENGRIIPYDVKLKDSGVPNGATLYLDLKVGGGG